MNYRWLCIALMQPILIFSSLLFAQEYNTRQWGTYYGGSRRDEIHSVASFGNNAIYAAGWTQSDGTGIISGPGAHQLTRGSTSTGSSGRDAMLIKFDGNGVRQWATYYGGNQEDQAFSVATDKDGNVYMVGKTLSGTGIATANAHKTGTFSYDAFLVKFNANGVRQWGTYYGSTWQPEEGVAVTVDENGNIYLVGNATGSTEGVSTANAHQETIAAQTDAFIVKFNSSGVRQWGTFYGGAGNDFATGCTTDNEGNVFLCGNTTSPAGISTNGSHQPTQGNVIDNDAFLVKFNSEGVRQWATYYGGLHNDFAGACRANLNGDIYLTGTSHSSTAIATSGSHQPTKLGNDLNADGFIAKFNGSGTRQWASYYGAIGFDGSLAVQVNTAGDVIIAGGSNSSTAIATTNAYQTVVGGNGLASDGFFAIFSPTGTRKYGTYYGAGFDDNSTSVCFDNQGNIIMAGRTLSTGSTLATDGAHQTSYNGDDNSSSSGLYDGFVVKFSTGSGATPTTFSFTGSGNWSSPANWQGNTVPPSTIPSGVTIIINPSGNNECVMDVPVTLSQGASLTVADAKKLRINGNLIIQ